MMKKSHVLLIVLFVLPLLDVFYSCCSCDDSVNYYYSYSDFSIKNIDNSGQNPLESDEQQINKNAYGIRLNINKELLSHTERKTNKNCYMFSSSAYAFTCDCDFSTYSAIHTIQSIKIFTLQNFDDEKPANSDISEYFRLIHSYKTVDESIDNINSSFSRIYPNSYVDYLLMNAPSSENINHQFRIEITLSNGEVFNLETTVILY